MQNPLASKRAMIQCLRKCNSIGPNLFMDSDDDELRRAFRSLFDSGLGLALPRASTISRIFHEELARCLQPVVNCELQRLPTQGIEDQKSFVENLEFWLKTMHIDMCSPETLNPMTLSVVSRARASDRAVYRLQSQFPGRPRGSWTSDQPPVVELLPTIPKTSKHSKSHRLSERGDRNR